VDLEGVGAPARRRRGQELEDALLDAAWEELIERGYGAFTIEAVAERAHTSRPVLYRRWPRREDLLKATLRRQWDRSDFPAPDTGSLRGDLRALLLAWNEQHWGLVAVLSVQLAGFFTETGVTLAELREHLLAGRGPSRLGLIIDRAVERGEVDPERLTPRVMTLPFDLFRHEMLMTAKPVPESVILEIVDTIFLPLVTPAT
jgi:AcrR family transcriptional regulator